MQILAPFIQCRDRKTFVKPLFEHVEVARLSVLQDCLAQFGIVLLSLYLSEEHHGSRTFFQQKFANIVQKTTLAQKRVNLSVVTHDQHILGLFQQIAEDPDRFLPPLRELVNDDVLRRFLITTSRDREGTQYEIAVFLSAYSALRTHVVGQRDNRPLHVLTGALDVFCKFKCSIRLATAGSSNIQHEPSFFCFLDHVLTNGLNAVPVVFQHLPLIISVLHVEQSLSISTENAQCFLPLIGKPRHNQADCAPLLSDNLD